SRGTATGQEGQTALPALRRGTVPDGGGPADCDLQGPAQPVLCDGRGGSRPGRCQPGRLLEIFTELRRDSQLIVITHQKRTMEIADALYGVAMRGDGV